VAEAVTPSRRPAGGSRSKNRCSISTLIACLRARAVVARRDKQECLVDQPRPVEIKAGEFVVGWTALVVDRESICRREPYLVARAVALQRQRAAGRSWPPRRSAGLAEGALHKKVHAQLDGRSASTVSRMSSRIAERSGGSRACGKTVRSAVYPLRSPRSYPRQRDRIMDLFRGVSLTMVSG